MIRIMCINNPLKELICTIDHQYRTHVLWTFPQDIYCHYLVFIYMSELWMSRTCTHSYYSILFFTNHVTLVENLHLSFGIIGFGVINMTGVRVKWLENSATQENDVHIEKIFGYESDVREWWMCIMMVVVVFGPEQVRVVVFNSTNVECMSLGGYWIQVAIEDQYL